MPNIEVSIPNTTITLNETGKYYRITPNEGYVMHDSNYDVEITEDNFDDEGNYTPIVTGVILGYRRTTASVYIANYDFTPYQMQDESGNTVTAYGARAFYTKLESDVPSNQIYGGGNVQPKPEIM